MHKARSSASTDRHVDKPSRQGGGGGGSAVSNFPDTSLLTEDEYKQDFNHIFNDECKFARMLRKLPRDEDEDKKVQKIAEISTYLDQQENIKFVLKLGKYALTILLRVLVDHHLEELRDNAVECIYKIGVILMNDRERQDVNKYFEWIGDKVCAQDNREDEQDNEIKVLLVQALEKYVLNSLKKLLETVDTPNLMIQIVKTILHLAKFYPDATFNIFQDVVDILIAWHIDHTQPDRVIDFTSNALVQLRPLWLRDLTFTINLLFQFMEDMNTLVSTIEQDLSKINDLESIEKVAALFKVFYTVVKSINIEDKSSRYIFGEQEKYQLVESLRGLLTFALKVIDSPFNELIFGPTNRCIDAFAEILEERLGEVDQLLAEYLKKHNQSTSEMSYDVDSSFLKLLYKVVAMFIQSNNIDLFVNLVSFDGRLWKFRFSPRPKLIQESLHIYKVLVVVKSIPIVQQVYKQILTDTEYSFETVLKCTCETHEAQSASEPSDKTIPALDNIKQAEISLLYNMRVFAELANAKNNLILMYALSPSLFELLTGKLSPCNWNLAEYFPNVQYAILNRLYSHCSRHDHFIASSSLLTSKFNSESTTLFSNIPTKDYLKIIIELLVKLLSHPTTKADLTLLILKWTNEIIDLVSTEYSFVLNSLVFYNLFNCIISSAYSAEESVCLMCNQVLVKYIQKFNDLNETILSRILDLCQYFLLNNNQQIRERYSKLLTSIPINASISEALNTKYLGKQDYTVFASIAKNDFMNSSYESSMSINSFKIVVAYVLIGILNQPDLYSNSWLDRIYCSSQRSNKEEKANRESQPKDIIKLGTIIENQEGLLWFWALWEAAQFCVQSRLKTPLGKAQDTFVAIEIAIKNFYNHEVQKEKKVEIFSDLSQLTLLINFVEHLEKTIYNAYEGVSSTNQQLAKPVKLFFRTNKSTCNEWFWRVRFYLTVISTKSGHYELAIRQAYEYIQHCVQHNLTNTNDFDQIVMQLVKSMIKLGAWEALNGLHKWMNKMLNKSYDWIKAASLDADQKLELASQGYIENIRKTVDDIYNKEKQSVSSFQLLNLKFQNDRVLDCYYQLHSWDEYLNWLTEYESLILSRIDNQSLKQQLENRIDLNYIKSMSSFDNFDLESANKYAKEMSASEAESLESLISSSIDCRWSVDEIESLTLKEIYTTVCLENNEKRAQICNQLVGNLLKVTNMDELSYWNREKIILLQLSKLASSQEEIPLVKSAKFDPHRHQAKFLNFVNIFMQKASGASAIDFPSEFSLSCSRLARKQHNFYLSSRLLSNHLNRMGHPHQLSDMDLYEPVKSFMNNFNLTQAIINMPYQLGCNRFEREAAKLTNLIENKNRLNAMELIAKSIANHLDLCSYLVNNNVRVQTSYEEALGENCSRSIITLTKWLSHSGKTRDIMDTINQYKGICSNPTDQVQVISHDLHKILNYKTMFDQTRLNLNSRNELTGVFNSHVGVVNYETCLGDLLDIATALSPKLAKSWHSLGDWCYKWAKKSVEKLVVSTSDNIYQSGDKDFVHLADLLPSNITQEEKRFVKRFLTSGLASFSTSINDQQIASSLDKEYAQIDSLFTNTNQLNRDAILNEAQRLLVESCPSLNLDSINAILDAYKSMTSRIYYYYRVACKAYFSFLQYNSNHSSSRADDESNTAVTLRILRLLVKYATELKDDMMQQGLASTPSQCWTNIIPQLFARLNHPEPYIRQSISKLLCRIAKEYPHLIIYPAVVGSQDGPTKIIQSSMHNNDDTASKNNSENNADKTEEKKTVEDEIHEDDEEEMSSTKGSTNDEDNLDNEVKAMDDQEGEEQEMNVVEEHNDNASGDEDEEEVEIEEERKVELKNTHKYLLDTLSEMNPKMIDQVKLFVHEMRRITLLREELWYGTLNQIHSDITKRIDQLNAEIIKINANTTLSDEERLSIQKSKYELFLLPIISLLENVHEVTTKLSPETPNEEQFQQEFGAKISMALNKLKDVENNAFKPANGWSLFKVLHHTFHQRSQRRQTTSLLMDQLSPKLIQLKATAIPIPGKTIGSTTVHSIGNQIVVLPTKTKPKKLYFVGSNGKRYQYLFKGLEDLHLDERIMQLLGIINSMFVKLNKSASIQFHALNYSVTPLGPRSGLISWVEGSTPLFTLYKKWQHREAIYLASKQQQQQQSTTTNQPIQIIRPNDLFIAKLNAWMKENNLTVKNFSEMNRTECPIEVLKKALEELIRETPGDLLSKELWFNASTPANWWKSTQMYTRSTAVMSMIGYVIGLGDRHLDNVLVNMSTGQVAHIDYNICFEKGQNLRVPERVPFRLTQNLVHAFGLTGVEGLFRISCEQVMTVLRRERETLLTLLEAFVYDPLLDWAGGDIGIIASFYGGGAKKEQISSVATAVQSNEESNLPINASLEKFKKLSRKNQEKSQTHQLYSLRLKENGIQLKQNKDSLMSFVQSLLEKVGFLCELNHKREQKEAVISLNERSKIYLDESLTLHNSTNSKNTSNAAQHPVYSLHERYDAYLEYMSCLNQVYSLADSLIDKFETYTSSSSRFFDFMSKFVHLDLENKSTNGLLSLINSLDTSSNEMITEQKEQDCVTYQAFQLAPIDEFLSSIGQPQLLKQCESLYTELNRAREERKVQTELSFNLIHQVVDTFSWFNGEFLSNQNSLVKLVNWMREMRISTNKDTQYGLSVDVLRRISRDYIQMFNPDLKLGYMDRKELDLSQYARSRDHNLNITQTKLLALTNELNSQEIKLIELNTRKLAITTQTTGFIPDQELSVYDMLKQNHDMLEKSALDFVDTQLESSSTMIDQLFESLNYVLIQFLNENLQKWINMESVAFSVTQEQLAVLNSRDGDWFLEEMLTLVQNCTHQISFLSYVYSKYGRDMADDSTGLISGMNIFTSLSAIFLSLRSILNNFETKQLEKLIKSVSNDLDNVSSVLNDIERINVDEFFLMIGDYNFQKSQLYSKNPNYEQKVRDMSAQYNEILLSNHSSNKSCSTFLIEMDNMFAQVNVEFEKCLTFCRNLFLQQNQSAIDQTYFALSPNLVYLFDEDIHSFYQSLFLAKKIKVIQVCLNICAEYNQYCFGSSETFLFTRDSLLLPLKTYISEYVVHMLAGLPTVITGNMINLLSNDLKSESLDFSVSSFNETFSLLLTQKLASNQILTFYYDTLNKFLIDYDTIWSNMNLMERIDTNTRQVESYSVFLKELLKTYQWFHEPVLSSKQAGLSSRQLTLNELELVIVKITTLSASIQSIRDKLDSCETGSVIKRLEWALASSPSLQEPIRVFESVRKSRNAFLDHEQHLYNKLSELMSGWLNFEQLRTEDSNMYQESIESFNTILETVDSLKLADATRIPQISDVELNLVQFRDFKDHRPLTSSAIQEYYRLLYDELANMKKHKQKEEKEYAIKVDEINKSSLSELKTLLNQHTKLMADIKPLLKTMSKYTDNNQLIISYSRIYQTFLESFQYLMRQLSTFINATERNNYNDMIWKEMLERLDLLNQIVAQVYDELWLIRDTVCEKSKLSVVDVKPATGDKQQTVRLNSRLGNKMIQESNSYAIGVWKRVYQKLDGKDSPNDGERLRVDQQVNYLIEQATDLNNLALMYEGWTSWV